MKYYLPIQKIKSVVGKAQIANIQALNTGSQGLITMTIGFLTIARTTAAQR